MEKAFAAYQQTFFKGLRGNVLYVWAKQSPGAIWWRNPSVLVKHKHQIQQQNLPTAQSQKKKNACAVTTCHKNTKVYHLKCFSCFFLLFLFFFFFLFFRSCVLLWVLSLVPNEKKNASLFLPAEGIDVHGWWIRFPFLFFSRVDSRWKTQSIHASISPSI